MTVVHRRWHWRIWLILTPLLIIGIYAALRVRPQTPTPVTSEERRP